MCLADRSVVLLNLTVCCGMNAPSNGCQASQAMSRLCPAQQLSHSKQAQIDIKDVATSKLRKELHTQSVEASEAAARLDSQEKSIHTTADQLTRSRQEVRPGQPACTAFAHP